MIGRGLAALGRAGTTALPAGIVLGLVFPGLAEIARPYLAPTVFLMLTVTMVRVRPQEALAYLARPVHLAIMLAAMMLVLPTVLALVLQAINLPPDMVTAIVLYALSPPLLASAAIALMLGLNYPMTLVTSMTATMLAPLIVPPLLDALVGVQLDISVIDLMLRIGLITFGSLVLALTLRRLFGPPRIEAARDHIAGTFVLLMFVFAVSIMDSVVDRLADAPMDVALYTGVVFLVNLALQAVGLISALVLGRDEGTAVAMMTGNRNMGITISVMGMPSDSDVFLFFALAQVPIFLFPALLRPLYRRLITPRPGAA